MKFLKIEKNSERFDLILNRPEKFNALNRVFLEELFSALSEIEKDKNCRLLVLRSSVKNVFCSGVDLNELRSFKSIEKAHDFALLLDATMIRLLKFPKPVIAVIDGLAFGGGFALASVADVRIISEKGKIAFPAARLGAILPPSLTFMLNALVGIGVSRDLLMTGRVVEAGEAFRLRLVNRLIKSTEIEDCLDKEVANILKSPDTALRMTRRITNQQLLVEIEKYNLTGAENFAYLASTAEWQKRIASFFDKNKS